MSQLSSTGDDLNLRGLIFHALGDFPSALLALEEARAFFAAETHHQGLSKVENNIALVRQSEGDLPLAQMHYEKAEREAILAGDPVRATVLCS